MTEAATPIQNSFNAGELSPRLGGRTDLAIYANGVAELLNGLPTVEGPVVKRSGSRMVQPAKTAAGDARLIPFEYNETQSYIIEATAAAFRFYTNNGRIETAPDVAYEVAVPYAAAELRDVDYEQSGDVLYLAHGSHQTRKLTRTSATTFALSTLELRNGPFKDQNSDSAVTVHATAATGSVTIEASAAIFLAGHVGALFLIEAKDFADTPAWEPGITVAVNDLRRSEGKVYRAAQLPASGSTRTGTATPIHTEGSEWDGMSAGTDINTENAGGVLWEYVHDRYGIVRIDAFTSTTEVDATVLRRLPDSVTDPAGASYRWAHAAFSNVEGWPSAVRIWNERLVLAKDITLRGSVVGDYENFAARTSEGLLAADMAFTYALGTPSLIRWLVADRQLLAGTGKAEHAIGALNSQAAPGPTNLQAPAQSYHGSKKIRPVVAGGRTLFVQRGGRKMLEAGYDFSVDRYTARNTTIRARHITRGGVVELAYQQEPEGLIWGVLGNGTLVAYTFSEEQEVRGWSRHVLGGFADADRTLPAKVESVAVIPDPAGETDQVWLLVSRWIDGAMRRYVERLETIWEDGNDVGDAFFVDSGLSHDGSAVTSISGLDHLAGETVWVLADGATHPDRVVAADGSIALDRTASKVHVGLPYIARVKTLRLDAGSDSGTAQAKKKRIVKLALRLLDALGLRVGQDGGSIDEVELRSSADLMNAAVPPFTGDVLMDFPGDYSQDAQIVAESYQPLPMTLCALMPRANSAD